MDFKKILSCFIGLGFLSSNCLAAEKIDNQIDSTISELKKFKQNVETIRLSI